MKQKTSLFSLLLLAAILACVSCNSAKHAKTKKLPGIWQATPITIDGSNTDWPSPYPEYDSKAMLGYTVSNDKDNLYITVETGDPATQLKIVRNGLTVWIDKTGGKEEVMAINYPLPEERDPGASERPQGQRAYSGQEQKQRLDIEDKVKTALTKANEYSLQGFKSCNLQYPLLERDSCGIVVRIGLDNDNELVWEAIVPLKTFYPKPAIDHRDKGRPLSICFETTGSKKPASQGSGGGHHGGGGGGMRPSVGMGGMGMGMHSGGGMRGGNRGGSTQNNSTNNMMEPLYKSTKTWKKTGIAFQE